MKGAEAGVDATVEILTLEANFKSFRRFLVKKIAYTRNALICSGAADSGLVKTAAAKSTAEAAIKGPD